MGLEDLRIAATNGVTFTQNVYFNGTASVGYEDFVTGPDQCSVDCATLPCPKLSLEECQRHNIIVFSQFLRQFGYNSVVELTITGSIYMTIGNGNETSIRHLKGGVRDLQETTTSPFSSTIDFRTPPAASSAAAGGAAFFSLAMMGLVAAGVMQIM